MNIKQKIFLIAALALIFIQFFFFAPSSVEQWGGKDTSDSSADKAEQIMTGINLYEKRLEEKDWELRANKAEAMSTSKDWVLYDIAIRFYGKKMEYFVYADQAIMNTENSNMKISGNVRVETTNGFEIHTTTMNYKAEKRSLKSPVVTKIISPKDKTGSFVEFQANSIVADLNLNQVLAKDNIQAIKYEKENNMNIYSDEATFQLDTRSASFVNQVKILYNTAIVNGPLANLKYDSKTDMFTEMQVSGGVNLRDKNRRGSSEEMVASFIKNYMVLKGSPRLIQDGDELIGNVIYLLNGGKQIKVEKAKAQLEDSMEREK